MVCYQPLSAERVLSRWLLLHLVPTGLTLSFTLKLWWADLGRLPGAQPAEGCRGMPAPPWCLHGLQGSLCSGTWSSSSPSDPSAHRAVSCTFYFIPHSCEVFCPFLNLVSRQCLCGELDCALLWGHCGTACGWGSPDVSSWIPTCSSPHHHLDTYTPYRWWWCVCEARSTLGPQQSPWPGPHTLE